MATADPAKAAIDGQLGAVVGRASCAEGHWSYAGPVHGGAVMQEHELAVGDSLVIQSVGTLVVKDVEGDAVLIGLELLDRAEEERLREQAEGAR